MCMDKKYEVKVTRQAMAQMKEIVHYISAELLRPEAANKLLDKMRDAIAALSFMPKKYALIEEEPWKHEGAKDEITEALDPEMVREVLDVVLALAREGRTMVIVTHEMQFAKAVADRMIFLEGGKIVEEGNPKEFFENPKTDRLRKFLQTFTYESGEDKERTY